MTQSAPTVLLYGQALVLIKELQDDYNAGLIKNVNELSERLRDVMTRFQNSAGVPFLQYDPVAETEPPLASKMNAFWRNLQYDTTLMQQQLDVLRASAIFAHNAIATEVLLASHENSRVANKIKTLQLYSNNVDNSIVTFGDGFRSEEFFDVGLVPEGERASIVGQGILALGQEGELRNLTKNATISILETSNGFAGNNQEIDSPLHALTDPLTGDPIYTFIAESNRAASVQALTDGEPNSWFEYEHCFVSDQDRLSAGNFNFTYQGTATNQNTSGLIDWAKGPGSGVLKLDLQFDLGKLETINSISYTPYGLTQNVNYPVLVKTIKTSPNGTDWVEVAPQNVWLGTDPNLRAARTANNVVTGKAVWSFEHRQARFVRVSVEQAQPIDTAIGHVYYIDKDTEQRVEGPVPPVSDPSLHYDPSYFISGDLIQQREYFAGKRWAIGIRDLLVQQVQYKSFSAMVTKPLRIGGVVDRVVLEDAEIYIPDSFGEGDWVRFYVSPDDGDTWYAISRVHDDYLGVPEIIAFNDPLPEAFHEPGVAYYKTEQPVTSLRLKIELLRPEDSVAASPLVRSYKLKVKRR